MENLESVLRKVIKEQTRVSRDRPFVTLTWAQSLDGKIAASPGQRTQISGESSSRMTHALRAIHDGILVGVDTVLADDPRLTSRLDFTTVETIKSVFKDENISYPSDDQIHPVPVILDSDLRTPSTAKCFVTSRKSSPIIVTSDKPKSTEELESSDSNSLQSKCTIHKTKGFSTKAGKKYLELPIVMEYLKREGIKSVMVEGGSSVLTSFFESDLCDIAIITIAPSIFGEGLPMPKYSHRFSLTNFRNVSWLQHGNDMVMVGFPEKCSTVTTPTNH